MYRSGGVGDGVWLGFLEDAEHGIVVGEVAMLIVHIRYRICGLLEVEDGDFGAGFARCEQRDDVMSKES